MPVPTSVTDLSTTAASNSPAGSDSPTEGDNYIRALSAFIRENYDSIQALGTNKAAIADLASTASATKGADMVGYHGATLADWFFGPIAEGADATGAVSSRAALIAADEDAAAAGRPLHIPPGVYLFDGAGYEFTAPVVMSPGARIKTSASTTWLKFGAGFAAGLYYCLDTDAPTQFLSTERIYPQWFGQCGLQTDDSTVPLTRAYRACRAACDAGTSTPDAAYGCRTVYFTSGVYRCNEVNVYCGTITRGEAHGSLFNALIQQIDRTKPALRMLPKNYGLDDTVLNDSNGQNHFYEIGFRSESISDSVENEPIVKFLSPSQATTLLGIDDDGTGGDVGHIDTSFIRTWWKDSAGSCIGCDEGKMSITIRQSIFDVVRRAVRYSGTANGILRSSDNWYYGCVRGAFENVSTSAAASYLFSDDDEFKAGNCQNAEATYRRAINWTPSTLVAGSTVRVSNGRFLRTDISGTRFGGPIFITNVQSVELDVYMKDPDSANNGKAIQINGGVRDLSLTGSIISDSLASYTTARLVYFAQSPQTLTNSRMQIKLVNTSGSTIETAVHSDAALTGLNVEGLLVIGNFTNRLGSFISVAGRAVPQIASAAALTLVPESDVFRISGTTAITSITATGWAGRLATLIFQGALTLTNGSNLKLASNFSTSADDTITMVCDGTNWHEVARSAI